MKFEIDDVVTHIKSGSQYRIIGTPDRFRLESNGEPAYAYAQSPEGTIWVRDQDAMEDGRFVAVSR